MDGFSICDPELEARYAKNNGPADESSYQAIMRTYQGFCKRIYNPGRKLYTTETLKGKDIEDHFEVMDFKLKFNHPVKRVQTSLYSVHWRNKSPESTDVSTCILYLHTNTSNLTDAMEVLPLCIDKGYHLLAFDLPGHGKSDAPLICPDTTLEGINVAIKALTKSGVDHVILWTRGMSTAAGFDFCSSVSHFGLMRNFVCLLVADCPFISVRRIVEDAVSRLQDEGYFIPLTLVQLAAKVMRSSLKGELGYDPYDVQPLDVASSVKLPCILIASDKDDYITQPHAEAFLGALKGACHMFITDGNHFEKRSEQFIKSMEVAIEEFCELALESDRDDAAPVLIEDGSGNRHMWRSKGSSVGEASQVKKETGERSFSSMFRRGSKRGSIDSIGSQRASALSGEERFGFEFDGSLDKIDESDINFDFSYELESEGSNKSRRTSCLSDADMPSDTKELSSPEQKPSPSPSPNPEGTEEMLMNMIFGMGP
jgi:pimeloyl-ACP methyl ester carboxylesterase